MASHFRGKMKFLSNYNGLLCRVIRPHALTRSFSEALVEFDQDDILTGSEMPLIFPPQAIKKGFEVHQSPRVFTLKPHEKMIWLTKSYLTTGMPTEMQDFETNKQAVEMIKDCIYQIVAFQKNVRKSSRTFFEEELSLGMLQQMLQVATMTDPPKSQDLYIHRKPIIETNWFRNFVMYNANYQPSLVLRTNQPLSPLKTTFPLPIDEFPATMPGPFSSYEVGAYEKSIIKLKNNTGVHHTKHFKKRHIHTILQVDTNLRDLEFFQSCGLMTSFTNLLTIAQDHGHPLGVPLDKPLNCNCIITNGTSMLLMVYQLNTTQMNDDKGIWNRAWCSPLMPLFTPKDRLPTRRQFHEISSTDGLKNFNEDAIELFLRLLSR